MNYYYTLMYLNFLCDVPYHSWILIFYRTFKEEFKKIELNDPVSFLKPILNINSLKIDMPHYCFPVFFKVL